MPTKTKTKTKPRTRAKAQAKRAPAIKQLKLGEFVHLRYKTDEGEDRVIVLLVEGTYFDVTYHPQITDAKEFVDAIDGLDGVPYLDELYFHVIKQKLPVATFHSELYSRDSSDSFYDPEYESFYENSDYDTLVSFKTLKEASVWAHALQYALDKREASLKAARRKQEAAKKAEEAKRKATLAKLGRLPANQKQVVKFFQDNQGAFGCNRNDVITLVSGLMSLDLKALLTPPSNDND